MFSLVVSILSITLSLALVRRKPTVIALNDHAEILHEGVMPSIEMDAKSLALAYLKTRYSWEAAHQEETLAQAKPYVSPSSSKAFEKTIRDLVAFSKGKSVSQRVYPTQLLVYSDTNRIDIVADRFTEIQGLRAATLLKVGLTFETGPRTPENPWGIYIVKEEER